MQVGICGYPGSGKTTVFQALAGSTWSERGVHYGRIQVPDPRIDQLAEIFQPKKKVYAEIVFMDVGGSARRVDSGAFTPEVVQSMRNADVLAHVVRGFANPMLTQEADLGRDEALFADEIVLLDLMLLEKRVARFKKEARKGLEVEITRRCVAHLETGEPLRSLGLSSDEAATLRDVQLLSLKPLITLYNLSEEAFAAPDFAPYRESRERGPEARSMALCGEIEAEIATLPEAEQGEFLEGLGLGEPARNQFIRTAYQLLDLISFLTAGKDECRAWPIRRGTAARRAAGKVHSDIERGFIRAEIYQLEEMLEYGSEAALKAAGKMRLEGKEYVIADGDVVNYRFNV
jgi:GTP-binding protein YchF